MKIEYCLFGNNASVLATAFSKYGNLLDVCNKVKLATTKNVNELIVMKIAMQLLSAIDHLHSCNIIHADIS